MMQATEIKVSKHNPTGATEPTIISLEAHGETVSCPKAEAHKHRANNDAHDVGYNAQIVHLSIRILKVRDHALGGLHAGLDHGGGLDEESRGRFGGGTDLGRIIVLERGVKPCLERFM
jgi:hypothetical protein